MVRQNHSRSIQQTITEMLRSEGGRFISGQEICQELGVSRTTVWKHVNELRDQGYVIKSIPRKGHKLIAAPDTLSAWELNPWLTTEFLGRRVEHYFSVKSTNLIAKDLARQGAADGTVVTTEHQSAGRGRSNRSWFSEESAGIQMSLILRPSTPPHSASVITQIGAAAVALALEAQGFAPAIKWPNDVLLSDRKVCGILTEMSCELDRIEHIVVGIGINVHTRRFPDDIAEVATSLLLEGGENLKRQALAGAVLNEFEPLYTRGLLGDVEPALSVCRRLSWLRGKNVSFEQDGVIRTGTAGDVDSKGRLEVEIDDGHRELLLSGEVHLGTGPGR
ncbi:MAG: biotin--[acetyl-CoA-carboxylase] ligase [Dethiosulfovibrio peptidovorans]|nr:MAG: biotin--[acetyl-CoA-carboxylase] ligase [Dethiosulfovibrio peptidovorans]